MNKKLIVITGIAVLALALASFVLAGPAYAQGATPPTPGYGPGSGSGMMGGYGQHGRMMYQSTGNGLMHDAMLDELAKALDLSREELDARIATGETPAQIALAQGLSREDFVKIMADARAVALAQAVADGALTQAQADWMASRMSRMAGRGFGGNCPMAPAQTNP
ncbi:MAG: hypothetical protein HYZ49_01560 [Chloroflexi bacterium]|nr:hypothetical protein [Chloroflexota bacterium]